MKLNNSKPKEYKQHYEKKITIIEGDGIGPEVTTISKALDAIAAHFGHEFEYNYCLMGAVAIDKTGNPLPDETIAACLDSDAILFGAIGHPKYDNDPNAKVRVWTGFTQAEKIIATLCEHPAGEYVFFLHHLSPLKRANIEGVDFIIFRELTGGIYFGKKVTLRKHGRWTNAPTAVKK